MIRLSILALFSAFATSAQQPVSNHAQQLVFRADTRIVEVAVIAQDSKHTPIRDLRKEDLRVFDNGIEQTILSFEKIGDAPASGKPARLTVVVLDALTPSWADQIYGRTALFKMLADVPEGIDRIAILGLDKELRVVHDFSRDGASLRAAVEAYDRDRALDVESTLSPFARSQALGRQPALVSQVTFQQRAAQTRDAFKTIAALLGAIEGEKNLIWIGSTFPGAHNFLDLEDPVRKLAAAKVVIYPVDPRGLTMQSVINDPAVEIARQTGGRAFAQSNDVARQIRTAFDDSREGYIFTYSPAGYVEDGSLHQVTLKTTRAVPDLRYRPWYFADPDMPAKSNLPNLPVFPLGKILK